MAADGSIFAQYLKPVKSVEEYQDEGDQRTLSRLKLLLGQQEAQQKQQGFADDAKFRGLTSQYGNDQTGLLNALRSGGLYGKAKDIEMGIADIAAKTATTRKAKVDADKDEWGIKTQKLDRLGQGFGWLKDNPSAENARAMFDDHVRNGILTPQEAAMRFADVEKNPTPENVRSLAMQGYQGILSAKDQLPQLQTGDYGGYKQPEAVNPITGQVTATGPQVTVTESEAQRLARETSTANNAATNATSRANNAASVGAQYANAKATRAIADSNVTAAGLRRDQDTEMKLADDYRKQSKDFSDSTAAFKQISATLDSANKSPAATLAAATKFMKILDPGSVVRESELGMALAATGVLDRVGNYMNTLQNGKTLTQSQVKDFKKISADMYEASKQVQKNIDKDYTEKAKAYKLRPEMVVQDLGQNASGVVDFGSLK